MKVRLRDVATVINGVTYKPSDIRYPSCDGSIPILRATNIQNGALDLSDTVYIDVNKVAQHQILQNGDIVICASSGSKNLVGKAAQITIVTPLSFGSFCKVVRPNNINPEYLYFFFQSPTYRHLISEASIGANINNIRNSHILDLQIPVPNINKQKNICEHLGSLSNQITKRNQQAIILDQLVKSRFMEMFGDLSSPSCRWNKNKLSHICVNYDDIKCGPFGTQLNKNEYTATGVPIWEIAQINSMFTTKPVHFITQDKAVSLNAYSIKPGDIAMSRKGNVGRCAIFPETLQNGIIHSDILRIRVDQNQVLPVFIVHQLRYSNHVKHQIELVSSGAIMAGINVTKLKQIEIHIPPLPLQQQFAAFVEKVDKSKLAVKQSLEKLETLKKSLMQQYFG